MRSLRWDMDALAVETWRHISAGDARDIRLREDTVSERNLLELDIRHHPRLGVHRFNQNAERRSGADWEWYIGSGAHWFALRVQAKRMDGMEYRQLQHPGDGDDYQYDTLIRNSAGQPMRTFPYYVFFNGWPTWPSGLDWYGCPQGNPLDRCTHAADLEFGCSAMPAGLVKAIHRGRGVEGRRVDAFLPYSVPWSWLFGSPQESMLVRARRWRGSLMGHWPPSPPPVGGWAGYIKDASEWDPQFDAPRRPDEWRTRPADDRRVLVHRLLAWHQAIADSVPSADELATLEDDEENSVLQGFWQRGLRQAQAVLETPQQVDVAGLLPLPDYAQALLQLTMASVDVDPRESREELRRFDEYFDGEQRTVIVTDLGQP